VHHTMPQSPLQLKEASFAALHTQQGLASLDTQFLAYLKEQQPSLLELLTRYRSHGTDFSSHAVSEFIIALAPWVESFIAELFTIEDAVSALRAKTLSDDPVFAFQEHFVKRLAKRALRAHPHEFDFHHAHHQLLQQAPALAVVQEDFEAALARYAQALLRNEDLHHKEIAVVVDWCMAALSTAEGLSFTAGWMSFKSPQKLDYDHLVAVTPLANDAAMRLQGDPQQFRQRQGFALTDPRMTPREVAYEIHYCVYCHKTEGDFCSKGFPQKKNAPELGYKENPLGQTLTGCPLEEKISEMHVIKRAGFAIAALAIVMVDNPMCPATGHRICNDCMKSCIYQKQEPVNIPQTETGILTDVLSLPWGVEIYDLLTRWNPLRQQQYLPKPYNGLKVLIMGMGPAGFTMAHHLLMEGFAVVGADGLKIEPLPTHLLSQPIRYFNDIRESLDERVMAGFGGVAEYGITVRWDKNFLKLIYISLLRRQHFQVFGCVRFGGSITVDKAWQLGFDHVVLAVGAGLPKELPIDNSLAPGMRQANDFLMALQLTGAGKKNSLASLQIQLPAVVIGGGLTGVDTATEIQAYYFVQIEKIAHRYAVLCNYYGEKAVRQRFDAHSLQVLDEFMQHYSEWMSERKQAEQAGQEVDTISLIRRWGGVSIVYRRSMQESPAYKRNHEELGKALEEGVLYAEALEPKTVLLDEQGWCKALVCRARVQNEHGDWLFTDEEVRLPARSILVATGARPNVAYEFEHRGTFEKSQGQYRRYSLEGQGLADVMPDDHVKIEQFGAFTSYKNQHHRVSFIGDTHPVFHGSVVNAIASAKRSYPEIVKSLQMVSREKDDYTVFQKRLENLFSATVVNVIAHAPGVSEILVRAPLAAQCHQPGQFYRLQNFETHAQTLGDTVLQTEALALLGVRLNPDPDMLSFITLEKGVSSRIAARLKPGQSLALMGPTGMRMMPPPTPQRVLVIGGSMAIVHLLALAPSWRAAGHEFYWIASFAPDEPLFCRQDLEELCHSIVWHKRGTSTPDSCREQDTLVAGELQQLFAQIAGSGDPFKLSQITEVMVIGGSSLLSAFANAREDALAQAFAPETRFSASVYGPMQCMLKGVCAQCLQWQIDPVTRQRVKAVYACSWQNQPFDKIDITNIDQRQIQNRMQETLGNVWLDYLLK